MSRPDPRRVEGTSDEPPPPRVMAACLVLAAVGLAIVLALGFLVYAAVKIFREVGGDQAGTDPPPPAAGPGGLGRPDPITATKLAANKATLPEIKGEFDAVCRGAGGRFLFIRVPAEKKLHVFDPVEAKVAHVLPLDDPKALFAASASKLFVLQRGRLERYDLRTWRKEKDSRPEVGGPPSHLLTGYGADGMVRLGEGGPAEGGDTHLSYIDPLTLATDRRGKWWSEIYAPPARPSADGRLIGVVRADVGRRAGEVLLANPDHVGLLKMQRDAVPVGHVTPSPNGRWVYTAAGPYHQGGIESGFDFVPVRGRPAPLYTMPTAQGDDLFVSLTGDAKTVRGPARLHLAGDVKPLADLPGPTTDRKWRATDDGMIPTAEESVHLWPAAGLLAVLTAAEKQTIIELCTVDVGAVLKAGGRDYLVFASDPPTTVVRGGTWTYRPAFWWSRPGTPVEVTAAGTPGVNAGRVGAESVVTWAVPRDFAANEAEVRLEATVTILDRVTVLKAAQTVRIAVLDPGS